MKLVRLSVMGLICSAAARSLPAQAPRPSWPEVDRVFQRFSAPGSPGCALGIASHDTVLYRQGYGLAVVEWGVPNDPATVYELGSVSKQFTAFAVLLLEREGRLSLGDDIRKWLPEFPRYAKPITIRHLIHHTSGIRDYDPLLVYRGTRYHDIATNADILDMLARQRGLNFPTGTRWQYSNSNYVLLALIAERASGKRFREFARERIFAPLGMTGTLIRDDHTELIPRHARGYQRPADGTLAIDESDWEETGDGSVQSSADDLLKWMDNLRTGRVGGPDIVRKMTETGRLDDGTPVDYASGLTVDSWRGVRRVAHGGSWAGYRSHVVRFPESGLAVVAACNDATANPGTLASAVAEVVLAGRLEPAPAVGAHTGTALTRLTGAYWSEEAGTALFVRSADGGLVVNRDGGPGGIPLVETGDRTFAVGGGSMTAVFASGTGPASGFTTRTGAIPGERYVRVGAPDTSAATLRRYAGRFRSTELRDARWTITAGGGGLMVRSAASTVSQPFRAIAPDVFGGMMFDDPVILQFRRSAAGGVTGFTISGFALRGLGFERER